MTRSEIPSFQSAPRFRAKWIAERGAPITVRGNRVQPSSTFQILTAVARNGAISASRVSHVELVHRAGGGIDEGRHVDRPGDDVVVELALVPRVGEHQLRPVRQPRLDDLVRAQPGLRPLRRAGPERAAAESPRPARPGAGERRACAPAPWSSARSSGTCSSPPNVVVSRSELASTAARIGTATPRPSARSGGRNPTGRDPIRRRGAWEASVVVFGASAPRPRCSARRAPSRGNRAAPPRPR